MSKELEILEDISKEECLFKNRNTIYMGDEKVNSFTHKDTIGNYFKGIEEIKQALQRLEAIDQSNPSEALKKLKENTEMFDEIAKENDHTYKEDTVIEAYVYHANNIVIEQTLLKEQELEKENAEYKKVLEIIKEKKVNFKHLSECDCAEQYNFIVSFTKYDVKRRLTQEEFELLKEVLECQNTEITKKK